jgi:hypothetical protein
MSDAPDEDRERPIGVVLWSSRPEALPPPPPDEPWIVLLIG